MNRAATDPINAAAWEGPAARIAVIVPTRDRAPLIVELLSALEAQDLPRAAFEVVVADDGSTDDTWGTLADVAARTSLRLRAVRLPTSAGPAAARNAAAAASRAPLLAFTDDDCHPVPEWLSTLARAFDGDVDIVQGRTLPDPLAPRGPWDRIVVIERPTPLYETCNIAYRRSAFEQAGGFATERPDVARGTRPHFGEDARLGWRVLANGGTASFAPDAMVHHRVWPDDYAGWLREQRRLSLFPSLVRETPGMRRMLWGWVFLGPATAAFDLAVASTAAAAITRLPWLLAGVAPWVGLRWRGTRWRGGRSPFVRLAQLAVSDAVGLAALTVGSLRARRVVL